MPPNRSPYQDAHSTQSFLQGINTMQMQAGLVPGGVYSGAPPIMPPPPRGPTPADFSNNLQVNFNRQQPFMAAPPPPMMGGVTPVRRPMGYEQSFMMNRPNLPPPTFGSPRGMAMQQSRMHTNEMLANTQAGLGVGSRMMGNMGAFAMGNAMGGPMGGLAGMTGFEHFGGGQMMQRMGAGMMNPLIENRANSLQLQNLSNRFVRGGADLSASGTGLSSGASSRLTHGLNQMAGSSQFQNQTDGMFNKQDVMKITRMAGEMGMLDQSQTADEIKQSVGKISRALTNFMKIAETPDVQEAMQMMGKMRGMGMDLPTTNSSMRNARAFARMAGTDVQGVMQAGMQGAGMYQRMGMTGAAGLNAGMAAQGVAAQLTPHLSPQQMALMGGQQGVANMMTGGAASAVSMRAMLPAMLTRQNGSLAIDDDAVSALMSGDSGAMQGLMRRSATSMRRLGGADRVAQELATQSGELQSQLSDRLGGMGNVLLPMMMARMIKSGTPGMTDAGALMTLGMGEQQARAMEQTMNSPEALRAIREQAHRQLREQRRDVAEERRNIQEASETPQWMHDTSRWGSRTSDRLSTNVNDALSRYIGDEEFDAEVASQGGGDVVSRVRASRTDSNIQRAAFSDALRGGEDTDALMALADRGRAQRAATRRSNLNREGTVNRMGVGGMLMNMATGTEGIGTDGQTLTSTLRSNMGTGEYIREIASTAVGLGMSTEELTHRSARAQRTGEGISSAMRSSQQDRDARFARILGEGPEGMSPTEIGGALGAATSKLNDMLDSNIGLISDDSPVTDEQIVSNVRETLLEQGVPQAEVDRMTAQGINSDVVQQVIAQGSSTRSADANQALTRAVSAGADAEAASNGRLRAATREQADGLREGALGGLGISTNMFTGMTTRDQSKLLDAMSGVGAGSEARRIAVAREAALAAGDNTLASELNAELINNFGAEAATRAKAEAAGALQDMDREELSDMGSRLADANEEGGIGAVTGMLNEAGRDITRAQLAEAEGGISDVLGDDAYAQFEAGGIGALRAYAQQGGSVEGFSESDMERLKSGEMTQAELYRKGARSAGIAEDVAVSGGLVSEAEDAEATAGIDSAIDSLQSGSRGSSQDRFVQSVDTFSQASEAMLEAARNMNDRDSLIGVGTLTMGATPMGVLGTLGNYLWGDD